MIRRTRCSVLLIALLVVNLVIISLLNYDPKSSLQQNITLSLFDVRKILVQEDNTENRQQFNEHIDAKFQHIYHSDVVEETLPKEKQDQLWLLDVSKDIRNNEIIMPDYLVDPDNYEDPQLQRFDPRLTLSLLFNHLGRKIRRSDSLGGLEIPQFHWADWVDLSSLNEDFLDANKRNCKDLFDLTTNNRLRNKKMDLLPPDEFCVDDDNIDAMIANKDTDESVKELLKVCKADKFSSGFHVFGYGGRSRKTLKVIQAKSYLHDFMPPPMSVVFLLPSPRDENGNKLKSGSNGLQVPVTQNLNERKKLSQTRLVKEYVREFMVQNKELLDTSKDIFMNIDQQLQMLTGLVSDKIPTPDDVEIDYEKVLEHEQFVDNSSDILASLEKMPQDTLTKADKLYVDSLKYSLAEASSPKYFNEAKIIRKERNFALGGHYDWRFFNGIINYSDLQSPSLHGLVKAWLRFTNTYNLHTWVAHGSLLSWYWDGVSFPWDNDIDVQMPIADLHQLSRYFNQSIIMDLGSGDDNEIRYGRYFLDCGSFISSRSKGNGNNNIDARFIDIDTGFYIDITGLAISSVRAPPRYNDLLPISLSRVSLDETIDESHRNINLQAYNCRNNHFARLPEVSPLRLTMVEGEPAYVPNDFGILLQNEYGKKGLMAKKFKGYTFLPRLRIWVLTRNLNSFLQSKTGNNPLIDEGDDEEDAEDDSAIKELTDDDYLKLLFEQSDLLIEYLSTREITQLHDDEIKTMIEGESTESLFLDEKKHLKLHFPSLRHDYFSFVARKENYKYENAVADIVRDVELYKRPKLDTQQPPEEATPQASPQATSPAVEPQPAQPQPADPAKSDSNVQPEEEKSQNQDTKPPN